MTSSINNKSITEINLPSHISSSKLEENTTENLPTVYLSKSKVSDVYLSQLIKLGILDSNGTLLDEYAKNPIPALEETQFEAFTEIQNRNVKITKPNAGKEEFSNLQFSSPIGQLLSEIYYKININTDESSSANLVKSFHLIGGIVPHCLRGDYLKRWLTNLLKNHHEINPSDLLNQVICKQLEIFPADIDTRLKISNLSKSLEILREEIIQVLSTKTIKPSILDPAVPPEFLSRIVREAYLLKYFMQYNYKDQFAIVSFGDRADIVLEILVALNLERNCLFRRDSLRISIDKFLETGDLSTLTLESDFSINQVLSDINAQVIHVPDFSLADEDDWITLISRMVSKGERCLTPGTEQKLFSIFLKKAQEFKKQPSKFIIERLKKRLLNHHNTSDLVINEALAFQTCISMKNSGVSQNEIMDIWKGLKTNNLNTPSENPSLFHQISKALENKKISFDDVYHCIELGSFIVLNSTKESPTNCIILTNHEGPAVQITLEHNGKAYHLWHRFNPETAFAHFAKKDEMPQELLDIFETFYAWAIKNPSEYSPLLNDLKKLPINPQIIAVHTESLLLSSNAQIATLGAFLKTAYQSLLNQTSLLKRIPSLIPSITTPKMREILYTHLANQNPILLPTFEKIINLLKQPNFDINSFIEQWILTLASCKDSVLWNSIIELACLSSQKNKILPLLKQLIPNDSSFAIAMLHEASKKNLIPLDNLLKALGGICLQYPKCKSPINREVDLFTLQLLIKETLYNPLLKNIKEPQTQQLLSTGFHWLLNESSPSMSKIEQFHLMMIMIQKEAFYSDDQHVSDFVALLIDELSINNQSNEIFEVIKGLKKTKIDWINLNKLLIDRKITVTKQLYELNQEEASVFADHCVATFQNSKDQNALPLILKSFIRAIQKRERCIEIKIRDSQLEQNEKNKLLIRIIEDNLQSKDVFSTKKNLADLFNSKLEKEDKLKVTELIDELTKQLLGTIDKQSIKYALLDLEQLYSHDKFRALYDESHELLLKFHLNLLTSAYPQYEQHPTIIIFCLSELIKDLSNPEQLSKSTWVSITKTLLSYLSVLNRFSMEKSHPFREIWADKFITVHNALKHHELFSECCQLVHISESSNFKTHPIDPNKLLESIKKAFPQSNPSSIDPIINLFENTLRSIKHNSLSISLLIEIGVFLNRSNKPELTKKILDIILQYKEISTLQPEKFLIPVLESLYNSKQYEQCAAHLITLEKMGIKSFKLSFNVEELILKLFNHKAKLKKQIDLGPIVELIVIYKITNPSLWNVLLPHIQGKLKENLYIEIYQIFLNEDMGNQIFKNDILQYSQGMCKIMEKLDESSYLNLHEFYFNPLYQKFKRNLFPNDLIQIQILLSRAFFKKINEEKDPNKHSQLLQQLNQCIHESCFQIHEKEINEVIAINILHLASLYLQETDFALFNLGVQILKNINTYFENLSPTPKPASKSYNNALINQFIGTSQLFFVGIIRFKNHNDFDDLLTFAFKISAFNPNFDYFQLSDPFILINSFIIIGTKETLIQAGVWTLSLIDPIIPPNLRSLIHQIKKPHVYHPILERYKPKDVGKMILHVINTLIKACQNEGDFTNKKEYFTQVLFLFKGEELGKYLTVAENGEVYYNIWHTLFEISKDFDDIENLLKILNLVPHLALCQSPIYSSNFCDEFHELHARLLCKIEVNQSDEIWLQINTNYASFYQAMSSNTVQIKKYLKTSYLNIYKHLKIIESNPITPGSLILFENCYKFIDTAFKKMMFDKQIIKDIVNALVMTTVRVEIPEKMFYSIISAARLISPDSKDQLFNTEEIFEIFTLLFPDNANQIPLNVERKKAIITKVLWKLLAEKPTPNLIIKLCSLVKSSVSKGFFQFPTDAFSYPDGNTKNRDNEMVKLINYASENYEAKVNGISPLQSLKDLIIFTSPDDLSRVGILGNLSLTDISENSCNLLLKLMNSYYIVWCKNNPSDTKNTEKFKYANECLNILNLYYLNSKIDKKFNVFEPILNDFFDVDISLFPLNNPEVIHFSNNRMRFLTLLSNPFFLGGINIDESRKFISVKKSNLNRYLLDLNSRYKTEPKFAIDITDKIINGIFTSVPDFHSNQDRNLWFCMFNAVLTCSYEFLSQQNRSGSYFGFYENYMNLCKKHITVLMTSLYNDFGFNLLKFDLKTGKLELEKYHSIQLNEDIKVDLMKHIVNTFKLFLETPSFNLSKEDIKLRAETLTDYISSIEMAIEMSPDLLAKGIPEEIKQGYMKILQE